jgi:hypothetical protein
MALELCCQHPDSSYPLGFRKMWLRLHPMPLIAMGRVFRLGLTLPPQVLWS